MKGKYLLTLILLFCTLNVSADVIRLKSGEEIAGKVIAETEKSRGLVWISVSALSGPREYFKDIAGVRPQ